MAAGWRVVSLVPSITECLGDDSTGGVTPVAVTRFCDRPGVPTVGGTKNPDIDAIVALAPDVVLMDAEENRLEDAEALAAAGVRVVATHVRSLADVPAALAVIGEAVGCPLPGTEPAGEIPVPDRPVRAFVPIWRRPWMTIGAQTYGSSLLSAAGFDNVYAGSGAYPTLDLDEAASLAPEVVLAPSEPYPFKERHRAELERVAPVRFVDGRDLFWWGVRTPAALGRLAQMASSLAGR